MNINPIGGLLRYWLIMAAVAMPLACTSKKDENILCFVLAKIEDVGVVSLPRDLTTRIGVSADTFSNYRDSFLNRRIHVTPNHRDEAVIACEKSALTETGGSLDARSRLAFADRSGKILATIYLDHTGERLQWQDRVFKLSGPLSSILVNMAWGDQSDIHSTTPAKP